MSAGFWLIADVVMAVFGAYMVVHVTPALPCNNYQAYC